MGFSGRLCVNVGVYAGFGEFMRENWDLCGFGLIAMRKTLLGGSVLRLLDVVVHDEFVFEEFVG